MPDGLPRGELPQKPRRAAPCVRAATRSATDAATLAVPASTIESTTVLSCPSYKPGCSAPQVSTCITIYVVTVLVVVELRAWRWVLMFEGLFQPIHLLVIVIVPLVVITPFWRIFKRAGFDPRLSILMVIPLANLVTLWYVAFARGSAEKPK